MNPPRNDTVDKEFFEGEEAAKNEDQMSRAMTEGTMGAKVQVK